MVMWMIFKLFENISASDVQIKEVHEVKEVLSFTNQSAMILANWFYREDGVRLRYDFNEGNHFVMLWGSELYRVVSALDSVFECEGRDRDLMALLLFPVVDYIPNSSVGMWSDAYYKHLEEVCNGLKRIMPLDSVSNRERVFYYNIRW